jgi:hypothetical protein
MRSARRLAPRAAMDSGSPPQPLGLVLVAVVLVNGALVATSLSLAGDRGPFLSIDMALLGALLTFAVASDGLPRAVRLAFTGDLTLAFAALILLIPLAAFRAGSTESDIWLFSHLVEVLRWSLMGAMATICVSRDSRATPSNGSAAVAAALFGTMLLWVALGWMYLAGLGAVRTDLFYIIATGGDYYQLHGDTLSIGIVAVMALQWRAMVAPKRDSASRAVGYMLLVLVQAGAAVVLLQLFGSNKAPVLVMLCVTMALWEAMPSSRDTGRGNARAWYMITFVLIVALLVGVLASIELPPIRLLSFGAEGGLLGGSSVQSRNEFLREAWLFHLSDRPILGNPTIGILTGAYLHSSVLSLQTNLGVVGTLLFATVLFFGWRRVRAHPEYIFIRLLAAPVLFISIVGTFFTWGPLWLLLSAMATIPAPIDARRDEDSSSEYLSPR